MPFPRRRRRVGETTATEPSRVPLPDLTRELLDASINNITTILSTPESLLVPRRAVSSLRDALKKLDMFYPAVLEGERLDEATRREVGEPGVRAGAQPVGGEPSPEVRPEVGREVRGPAGPEPAPR